MLFLLKNCSLELVFPVLLAQTGRPMPYIRSGAVVQQRSLFEEIISLPYQIYCMFCTFLSCLIDVRQMPQPNRCCCLLPLPACASVRVLPPHPGLSRVRDSPRRSRRRRRAAAAAAAQDRLVALEKARFPPPCGSFGSFPPSPSLAPIPTPIPTAHPAFCVESSTLSRLRDVPARCHRRELEHASYGRMRQLGPGRLDAPGSQLLPHRNSDMMLASSTASRQAGRDGTGCLCASCAGRPILTASSDDFVHSKFL